MPSQTLEDILTTSRLGAYVPAPHDNVACIIQLMSTPPDEPSDADSDDLDDLLDETGAVTNRSDGKTGTDTEAEPNRKS